MLNIHPELFGNGISITLLLLLLLRVDEWSKVLSLSLEGFLEGETLMDGVASRGVVHSGVRNVLMLGSRRVVDVGQVGGVVPFCAMD